MAEAGRPGSLLHQALLCRSDRELLDHAVPFAREGLVRGEAVIAAVHRNVGEPFHWALGGEGGRAEIVDAAAWYRHPATTILAYHRFITGAIAEGSPAVRIVGEPAWPAGPPGMVREWERYESVLNAVLWELPVRVLCPYQLQRVPPSIAEGARRTHPEVLDVDGVHPSDGYVDPERFLAETVRFAPPPRSARSRKFEHPELREARHFIERAALEARIDRARSERLVAAAGEVVTNAFRHARGPVEITVWRDGEGFVCQIDDPGPGIPDPLAGYRPPAPDRTDGRGLWIARQLADMLEIGASHRGRASVRLHLL